MAYCRKEEDKKRQDELVKQKLEERKLQRREKTDLFELTNRGAMTARPTSELGRKGDVTSSLGFLTTRPSTAAAPITAVEEPIDRKLMDAQLRGKKSPRNQEDLPTAWDMDEDNSKLRRQHSNLSYEEDINEEKIGKDSGRQRETTFDLELKERQKKKSGRKNYEDLVIDGEDGHEIMTEKKKKKKKRETREAATLEAL